jgi:hypothetical protein
MYLDPRESEGADGEKAGEDVETRTGLRVLHLNPALLLSVCFSLSSA